VATNTPLVAPLSQGAAGCDLLVQPTVIDALLLSGGLGTPTLSLPDSPALAGARRRQNRSGDGSHPPTP
jgi:hypothetical protein